MTNKMWRRKSGNPNKSGASRPRRHIFVLATYLIKCGAPHFTGEIRSFGSVGELVGNHQLYPEGSNIRTE